MVLRLISRSPRGTGFLAPVAGVMQKHHRRLGASVAAPGDATSPYANVPLVARHLASTASRLTFGDDWPNAPHAEAGRNEHTSDLRFWKSEIFYLRGLDKH
jgi:hypothetical protein